MRLFRNILDKIGWSSGHAARVSILNIVLGLWTLVWILIGCMFVDLSISPVAAAFVFPILSLCVIFVIYLSNDCRRRAIAQYRMLSSVKDPT